MDSTAKLIARKMFKLRVHEAKGLAFQHLFERIMQYSFSDFTPIRPYGNEGDRKNDGYIPSEGRFFQVYAPENPSAGGTAVAAAQKASRDFALLKAYWDDVTPVRMYQFVFNDEYRGSPPPLEMALANIRNTYIVAASAFLAKDLEALALSLAEDELVDVIGTPIPEPGVLRTVDFTVLREVIVHVLKEPTLYSPSVLLRAPDFDDKIRFNGLSVRLASLLTVGSYQSEAVTDYFSKNSTFARQELRDRLNSMYTTTREEVAALGYSDTEIGDFVFFKLLDLMTATYPAATDQKKLAQDAAIVIIAYYFEACDIFEEPSAVT